MLTDVRLWRRYPLLLVIRLAQNTIRTTALLFFILVPISSGGATFGRLWTSVWTMPMGGAGRSRSAS